MTRKKVLQLVFLLLSGLCLRAGIGSAQDAGSVPRDVTANPADRGILVTSKARGNEFSLLLEGRDIRPLSSERLKLSVDGRDVEVVTVPLAPDLTDKRDAEILALYQGWVLSRSEKDGWQLVPGSNESLAFPDGRASLLWQMQQKAADGPQPQNQVVAATTNGSNVVALLGSSDSAGDLNPTKAFLRATLFTLRREKPVEMPAPTEEEVLNAGANLRQVLEVPEMLTGREYRALLNKRVMTEADDSLATAIPVEPEILRQGLRRAVANEGNKASVETIVFDGKAAHAINIMAYDPSADAYVYFDPWGKGSFLAAGSNAAGVTATPDSKRERLWIVTAEQLDQITYAFVLEFDEIQRLAANMPLGAFGALGDRLVDAEQTDLFTFFHLKQSEASRNAVGHQVLTFRPSSAKFQSRASLDMTIDESGRLLAADLSLLRSFIDDRVDTAFARDFAKSFLRSATSAQDKFWIEPLANQIELDVPGLVLLKPTDVVLPPDRTDDYLTFLGQRQDAMRQLSLTKMTLTNAAMGKEPALLISLETVR